MRLWRSFTNRDYNAGDHRFMALSPAQHARPNWLTFVESEKWVAALPGDAAGAIVLCPKGLTEAVWRRGHKPVVSGDASGEFWALHRMIWETENGGPVKSGQDSGSIAIGDPFKVFRGQLVPALGGLTIGDSCTFGAFSIADRGIYGEYTEIHNGVHIDNHVHVGHSAIIDDGAIIAAGAIIGGWAEVGTETFVGIGAVIKDNVKVGAGCTVGAGAVVVKDMPDGAVWAGVPAGPNFRGRA